MKRMLPVLLAALLLVSVFAPVAVCAETATSGTCGEGINWSYSNYTLTISGEGEMADGSPWEAYKDRIETVILTGGITKIGEGAFENYDALEKVHFGDALVEIGKRAFYDCNDIVEIRLPATFRRFGEESFRNCQSLERVICEGGIVPSFKSSCLYTDNYISIFYPPNNPWSEEYYGPIASSYGGKLGFMMASEDIMNDTFVFETKAEESSDEETTQATEERISVVAEDVTEATEATAAVAAIVAQDVTEATVPATTESLPTMPSATLPPATDPTVAATTEMQTIEATQLRIFEETTEPAQEEEKGSFMDSSWMGIVMIAGVLTFVLAGIMIMRNNRHKGGRFGE